MLSHPCSCCFLKPSQYSQPRILNASTNQSSLKLPSPTSPPPPPHTLQHRDQSAIIPTSNVNISPHSNLPHSTLSSAHYAPSDHTLQPHSHPPIHPPLAPSKPVPHPSHPRQTKPHSTKSRTMYSSHSTSNATFPHQSLISIQT